MKLHISLLSFLILPVLVGCGDTAEIAPTEQSNTEPTAEMTSETTEETATEAMEESTSEPSSTEDSSDEAAVMEIVSEDVEITSEGQAYLSYVASPTEGGPYPGIVLIHSFRGLEEGYRTMTDRFAAEGFVVLAVGWQTFEESPPDTTVQQLVGDSAVWLQTREAVDPTRLGLTGFCAGGRYTMLLLPQMDDTFAAGVAWYGFPYGGETKPASLIDDLDAPMLIIHGTEDQPSPIEGIYQYTEELEAAGKDFELEIYEGEPHGFMLSGGQLQEDENATDAFNRMVEFFTARLG